MSKTRNALKNLLLFGVGLSFYTPTFGLTNSQTFSYQGRFLNAAGTAPLNDKIDILISIYNPAANCLLYEEKQTNIDLTTTSGIFSVQVGSPLGATKRTSADPALSMSTVYSNNTPLTGSGGCTFTPVAGNNRRIRVTITPYSTGVPVVLNPDQAIGSVPQALSSDTLQGLDPSGFVQTATGVTGQANVNLANLITLTGGGDATAMHNHDGVYVRTGGGSPAYLGSSAYTNGNFGIGISTPTTDLDFGGNVSRTIQVDRNTTSSPGSSFIVAAGGAKVGTSNSSGGNLVLSGGIATGSGGSGINFNTASGGSSGTSDTTPSTKMVLSASGKLGVNALVPVSQIEVHPNDATTIGSIIKLFAGQSADSFQILDSTGTTLSKFDAAGYLSLPGVPTAANQAATKQYVDATIAASAAGAVSSFNTRTGAVLLNSTDVTNALGYTPLKNSTDTLSGNLTVTGTSGVGGAASAGIQSETSATIASSIGAVIKGFASQTADLFQLRKSDDTVLTKFDKDGVLILATNPTVSLGAATKQYVDTAIAATQPSGSYITSLTSDVTATGPNAASATVVAVGGSSASSVNTATLAANAATSANTASTIVKRDGSGNFSAGTISANLTGNVSGNVTGASSLNVLKSGDTMSSTLNIALSTDALGVVIKGNAAQTLDLQEWQSSAGTVLAKITSTGAMSLSGPLALPANPTTNLQAATKQYVDSTVAASTAGAVSSFNARTGAVVLNSSDVTSALTYTPLKNTTDTLTGNLTVTGTGGFGGAVGASTQFQSTSTSATQIGAVVKGATSQSADLLDFLNSTGTVLTKVDSAGFLTLPGNPTTPNMAANKAYVDSAVTAVSGAAITALTGDVTATGPGSSAATVAKVGTSTAVNIHTAELAANAATPLNTFSAIVQRDPSGNFTAGTISGSLTGAASLNVLKAGDTMSGALKVRTATTADALAQILIATGADTNKGLVVQGNSATQSADLLQFQNSTGSILASFSSTGYLTLPGVPTASSMAATKGYVDTAIATAAGVTSFDARTGAVVLNSSDVTSALTYTPLKNTTDTLTGNLTVTGTGGFGGAVGASTQFQSTSTSATQIGAVVKGATSQSADLLDFLNSTGTVLTKVDSAGFLTLPGNPTTPNMAANKAYVDSAVTAVSGAAITALTGDVTATGPGSSAATVAKVGTSTAVNIHTAELAANAATPLNTFSAIVQRDPSGNFTAGTISGSLTGAASLNVLKAGDTMSGALKVRTATTADALAQILIATGADTNKGLVVQGNSATQSADLLQFQNSTGSILASFSSTGYLTLPGVPTASSMAATKGYVDTAIATAAGVTSFDARTGAVVLNSSDVTSALTYTPLKNTTDTLTGNLTVTGTGGFGGAVGASTQFQSTSTSATQIGAVVKGATSQSADLLDFLNSTGTVLTKVDSAGFLTLPGNPTTPNMAANKAYVDSAVTAVSGAAITALTGDVTATGPGSSATTVAKVGTSTAVNIHTAELAANAATPLNTVSTIVQRDPSGNFTAGTISGSLTGAASLNVLKAGDTMSGALKVRTATTADALAQILIATGADTNKGLVVQGNSATQSADLLQFQNSTGSILASFSSTGYLTLPGVPTASSMAATKGYVDTAIATAAGVTSFDARTGAVVLNSSDVTSALTYTPLKNTTDTLTGNLTVTGTGGFGGAVGASTQFQSTSTSATQIGAVVKGATSQSADLLDFLNSTGTVLTKVDSAGFLTLPGNPTTPNMAANKAYVDSAVTAVSGAAITALTGDVTATGPGSSATTVAKVGTSTAVNIHTAELAANAATPLNTFSAIVQRDPSGNFTAGTISGSLTGAASLNVLKAGDTMSGALKVRTATTADALAQILIATGADTNKGLVVQGNSATQSADLLQFQNSTGSILSSVGSTGFITLPGSPTANLHAATKAYVDTAILGVPAPQWTSSGANIYNTNTGSVGIGSTVPTSHLSVVTADSTRAMDITTSYSVTNNGYAWLNLIDQAGTSRLKIYSSSDGSAGVNNTRIDSAGNLYLGPGGGGSLIIDNGSGSSYLTFGQVGGNRVGASSSDRMDLVFSSNGERMRISNASGNVGIGTNAPSYTLHVNGSVAGTSAYNNLSDARLKTDIKPLESVMDKLSGLHGITFKWKDSVKMKEVREQIGFIAQDVQKVFPQAVTTQNDGFLSVAYSMIIPPAVEAVKMIYGKVIDLEVSLHKTDARVAALEKENEALKKRSDVIMSELEKMKKNFAELKKTESSGRLPTSVIKK